jgi:hypothetical protein
LQQGAERVGEVEVGRAAEAVVVDEAGLVALSRTRRVQWEPPSATEASGLSLTGSRTRRSGSATEAGSGR